MSGDLADGRAVSIFIAWYPTFCAPALWGVVIGRSLVLFLGIYWPAPGMATASGEGAKAANNAIRQSRGQELGVFVPLFLMTGDSKRYSTSFSAPQATTRLLQSPVTARR